MEHQCSNYRDHHSGEFSGNYPCAICALEKRVEALEQASFEPVQMLKLSDKAEVKT